MGHKTPIPPGRAVINSVSGVIFVAGNPGMHVARQGEDITTHVAIPGAARIIKNSVGCRAGRKTVEQGEEG